MKARTEQRWVRGGTSLLAAAYALRSEAPPMRKEAEEGYSCSMLPTKQAGEVKCALAAASLLLRTHLRNSAGDLMSRFTEALPEWLEIASSVRFARCVNGHAAKPTTVIFIGRRKWEG